MGEIEQNTAKFSLSDRQIPIHTSLGEDARHPHLLLDGQRHAEVLGDLLEVVVALQPLEHLRDERIDLAAQLVLLQPDDDQRFFRIGRRQRAQSS